MTVTEYSIARSRRRINLSLLPSLLICSIPRMIEAIAFEADQSVVTAEMDKTAGEDEYTSAIRLSIKSATVSGTIT